MATVGGVARKGIGGVSTLLLVLWLALAGRALSLWLGPRIRFQILMFGFHLVVITILLMGVSWGFWRGEKAGKIFGGIGMLIAFLCFMGALYYWITGFILSRNPLPTYGAISLFFTGIVIAVLVFLAGAGLEKLDSRNGSND
jgi:hypothetical protein